jgi:hypothetical protein
MPSIQVPNPLNYREDLKKLRASSVHATYGPAYSSNARSSIDVRHAFVGTVIWNLPQFRNHSRIVRAPLGGWQLSSIIHLQSGFYYSITGSTLIGTRMADYVGGPGVLPDPGPNGWFNPAAFAAAPQGRWGTAGAGDVEGPGMQIYNISLTRFFNLRGDRMKLRFRADFMNAFNNVNFQSPRPDRDHQRLRHHLGRIPGAQHSVRSEAELLARPWSGPPACHAGTYAGMTDVASKGKMADRRSAPQLSSWHGRFFHSHALARRMGRSCRARPAARRSSRACASARGRWDFTSSIPMLRRPESAIVKGVWPGIKMARGRAQADAGPTGEPWVDSNGWIVRLARALHPDTEVWIDAPPAVDAFIPADSYRIALADTAMHGGRWIVSLDAPLTAALSAGKSEAQRPWKTLTETAAFFAARKNWPEYKPAGVIGVISDFSDDNEFFSGEVLNLLARTGEQYRILPRQKPWAAENLQALLYADPEAPARAVGKQIMDFVEAGGLLIANRWTAAAGEQLLSPLERYSVYAAGKGRIAIAKAPSDDPYGSGKRFGGAGEPPLRYGTTLERRSDGFVLHDIAGQPQGAGPPAVLFVPRTGRRLGANCWPLQRRTRGYDRKLPPGRRTLRSAARRGRSSPAAGLAVRSAGIADSLGLSGPRLLRT